MSVKVTLHPTDATKVHNVFGIAMLWKLFSWICTYYYKGIDNFATVYNFK